jgi:hypothetical protein
VCGSGTGAGETPVGGWQLHRGELCQSKPYSTGAVSGSGTGSSHTRCGSILWTWNSMAAIVAAKITFRSGLFQHPQAITLRGRPSDLRGSQSARKKFSSLTENSQDRHIALIGRL